MQIRMIYPPQYRMKSTNDPAREQATAGYSDRAGEQATAGYSDPAWEQATAGYSDPAEEQETTGHSDFAVQHQWGIVTLRWSNSGV